MVPLVDPLSHVIQLCAYHYVCVGNKSSASVRIPTKEGSGANPTSLTLDNPQIPLVEPLAIDNTSQSLLNPSQVNWGDFPLLTVGNISLMIVDWLRYFANSDRRRYWIVAPVRARGVLSVKMEIEE